MSQTKHYIVCLFMFFLTSVQASEKQDDIAQKGKLDVCIWPSYFSISYYNNRTNKLEGIDIDLSQALASDLNVTANYITTDFGHFMNDLDSDKCDIAMFGIGNTETRRKRVDFSEPYLASGMYAITVKQHPFIKDWKDIDQPGAIVSVLKGTYMEVSMRKQLKHASLQTTITPNQRELDVRSGRADVFITDFPYGQKMISLFDWAKLITPTEPTDQFRYAYAIKKGQPQWLARVNEFVAQIKKDGRLKAFAEKNHLTPIAIYN
jgi:ABC-type amino acid transport substrate-binding protein